MFNSGLTKFQLIILFLICGISPVISQDTPPQILNPESEPLEYCNESVFIAPEISVRNVIIDEENEGMKVSIVNFRPYEDVLEFVPVEGLRYYWNHTKGILEIKGIGTAEAYEDAIRKVIYRNSTEIPNTDVRTFSISLLDADYLPKTGHFYRYIKNLNITWKDAKAATDTMNYYGLQGYLATVTSIEENDFIWSKLEGVGWIGASDEEKDDEWKWVTGPEKGQQFWQGSSNGSAVNNMFSNWASGEPNNAHGGQQFAHFNQHPEKAPKSWNDMNNDGSGSDPQYYTPQGFVVEFGEMPGDPDVQLSASVEIKVSKIAFSENTIFEICEGDTLQLNVQASNEYAYNWGPDEHISSTLVSNPFVYPILSTTYKAIAKLGQCIDSLSFQVNVKPVPEIDFRVKENTIGCSPLTLNFVGEQHEEIESYFWDFNDGSTSDLNSPSHTFQNDGSAVEKYNVQCNATLKNGCVKSGALNDSIVVLPLPTVDFDFEEYECNKETSVVNYLGTATGQETFLWDLEDFQPEEIISNPGNTKAPLEFKRSTVPTVEIGLKIISENGCETDYFFKTWKRKPLINVSIDNTEGCPPLLVHAEAKTIDNIDEVDFYWNFGDGISGNGESVYHSYEQPDSGYEIQLLTNSLITGCNDTIVLEENVFTFETPKAAFVANPAEVFITNPVIQFENKSENAIDFEWDFGDYTTPSNQENPIHRFTNMGTYLVELSAFNDLGCVNTSAQEVIVAFEKVYPPTVFSPNATFWEDQEFRIYAEGIVNEGYELKIFNRWGENIFTSNSQEVGWDGRMKNGNFAPAGIYNWVIQYLDFTGKSHKQQGNVTLLF